MELQYLFQPSEIKYWSLPGMIQGEHLGDTVVRFSDLSVGSSWKEFDAVVLGVSEGMNSPGNHGCCLAPDLIRKYLYGLRKFERPIRILDLGNIAGSTIKDKYVAVQEAISILQNQAIPVLVIGGGQDFTLPLAKGLKKPGKGFCLSLIDSVFNYSKGALDYSSHCFLNALLDDSATKPDRISVIALQKYLNGAHHFEKMKELQVDWMRIGELRGEGLKDAEPFIRDAELISFDASAICYNDMPAQQFPMPNGLTAFESCQLAWFAGMSDKLKIFSLFEINPEMDGSGNGVFLGAQICWHFLEGLSYRNNDYPVRDIETYSIFHVKLEQVGVDIRFFCNPENQRWWVELPGNGSTQIFPCRHKDYERIKENEIPEKWWKYLIETT